MEINPEQVVLTHQQPTRKKTLLVVLVVGIIMLVTGGIIWYTLPKTSDKSEYVALLDSDSDLLSDVQEKELGTDPNKDDTDSDGLTDYLEIQLKTDPKNAHSISGNVSDSVSIMKKQLEQEQIDREARLQKLKQQN